MPPPLLPPPHHYHRLNNSLLSITQAIHLLRTNNITTTELSLYCYNLALHGEKILQLNAFTNIPSKEYVLAQAYESEERFKNGTSKGLLDGIPITIKSNIAVKGFPLTACSRILGAGQLNLETVDDNDHLQQNICGYDSHVAHQLLCKNGAILIGMTAMDEFGMGSLGNNLPNNGMLSESSSSSSSSSCITKNPLPHLLAQEREYRIENDHDRNSTLSSSDQLTEKWIERIKKLSSSTSSSTSSLPTELNNNKTLSTGGSSSGSAASILHGSSLASIGTDTGGSVRLPSAWCGIVGFKPSYGLISRHGVVSYASSLDTVGILAPTVSCTSLVMDALANRSKQGNGGSDNDNDDDDDDILNVFDSTATTVPVNHSFSDWIEDAPKINHMDNTHNPSHKQQQSSSSSSSSSSSWLQGLTIGIPEAFSIHECPTKIQNAWRHAIHKLESYGAKVCIVSSDMVSPDNVKMSLPAYYVLACAEASSNLSRYDGLRYGMNYSDAMKMVEGGKDEVESSSSLSQMTTFEQQVATLRTNGFGDEVKRRILCGTAVLSSDRFHSHYEGATKIRAEITNDFHQSFGSTDDDDCDNANDYQRKSNNDQVERASSGPVDLMIIPTAISDPPLLDPNSDTSKPKSTEAFANDIMTVPISLAGLPSVSVPIYCDAFHNDKDKSDTNHRMHDDSYDHPVVGIQIFGPKLSEKVVLRAAHVIQN